MLAHSYVNIEQMKVKPILKNYHPAFLLLSTRLILNGINRFCKFRRSVANSGGEQ